MAKGYFKNEEKTREHFFTEGGKRWIKSGDIGEFDKVTEKTPRGGIKNRDFFYNKLDLPP